MTNWLIAPSALLIAGLTLVATSNNTMAEGETPTPSPAAQGAEIQRSLEPSIVARFNGQSVTKEEIASELTRPEMRMLSEQLAKSPDKDKTLRVTALTSLITRSLLLKEARASKLLSPDEINKEVDRFVTQQGGKDRLLPLLAMNKMPWDKFTGEISDGVRLKHYVENEVTKGVAIQESDIEATFTKAPTLFDTPEKIRARHILIRAKDENASEVLEKASKILQDIRDGKESFDTVVISHSEDDTTKSNGGDLGFFSKGTMVPEFEEVAFSLRDGEVGGPVKTRFGVHIIKVESRTPAVTATLENSRERIRAILLTEARAQALSKHLEVLQERANIEIVDPEFRGAEPKGVSK